MRLKNQLSHTLDFFFSPLSACVCNWSWSSLWKHCMALWMSTTAEATGKKKRTLLYIIYIHFSTKSEKICTTWFEILKYYLWTGCLMVIYPWQQTKHGQECFDNFGSTDSSLTFPPPSQLPFSDLPCWTSTHVISSSNISGVHSQRREQKGRKTTTGREREVSSSSNLGSEDPVLRQHAKMDTNMTWNLDQVMTELTLTKVHVDITVQSPTVTTVSVILS